MAVLVITRGYLTYTKVQITKPGIWLCLDGTSRSPLLLREDGPKTFRIPPFTSGQSSSIKSHHISIIFPLSNVSQFGVIKTFRYLPGTTVGLGVVAHPPEGHGPYPAVAVGTLRGGCSATARSEPKEGGKDESVLEGSPMQSFL